MKLANIKRISVLGNSLFSLVQFFVCLFPIDVYVPVLSFVFDFTLKRMTIKLSKYGSENNLEGGCRSARRKIECF